jgi:3-deoxy-manno-octulosonate cytidylyltransferase (CMP-KDO synthetase)
MDALGVIPARFASTRFPGKVLAPLAGKAVLQHVWEKALQSKILEDVVIATDDARVKDFAETFGARAILTSSGHLSGTDRICEIVNPRDVRVVLNIQADEPFIEPAMLDSLALALLEDKTLVMATLIYPLKNQQDLHSPNVVKVVKDRHNFALYFSRSPIPFLRNLEPEEKAVFYKHIGIYAYSKDFLFTYAHLAPTLLEKAEGLEQLRVLENGYRIKLVESQFDTISIDTPQDLAQAEIFWQKRHHQ